jgi:hypothetical protein
VTARILAERMKISLGQPVIIENVGAAQGSVVLWRRASPNLCHEGRRSRRRTSPATSVLTGDMSAHAGMVEAGLRKRRERKPKRDVYGKGWTRSGP